MVNWIYENIAFFIEIIAVVFGLTYVLLAARNNIWCWFFGVVGSLISIILFFHFFNLVAESMLYLYYVGTGIYGWLNWSKMQEKKEFIIVTKPLKIHLLLVSFGLISTYVLSLFIQELFAEASYPLLDSFTTVFSIITTILVVKKWMENWLYWIVINTVTVYLYFSKGINYYGLLTIFYVAMSIYGYFNWRKLLKNA